ncbi:MAG: hypothetical protein ABIC82_00955 [bacterium]
MKERIEVTIQEPKYPELEQFMTNELSQEIKKEIAKMVFAGEISGLSIEASEEDILSPKLVFEKIVKPFENNKEPIYEIYDSLGRYFQEKVLESLLEKSTELLRQFEDDHDKVKEIIAWYEKIKKEAEEKFKIIFEKWTKDVIDYARYCERENKQAEDNGGITGNTIH